MKKVFTIIAVAVMAICLTASVSFAGDGNGVVNSVHDLSAIGLSTDICGSCHVPHNVDPTVEPSLLWNHTSVEGQTYTLYSSAAGPLDGAISQPDGTTKLCLGCHDGSVALDAFGGAVGTTSINPGAQIPKIGGFDLSRTHPVSIVYVSGAGTGMAPVTAPFGPNGLFIQDVLDPADKVQCSTCHDVHNEGVPESEPGTQLLRVLNTAPTPSAMCLACHLK